jgi:hypothetical protein
LAAAKWRGVEPDVPIMGAEGERVLSEKRRGNLKAEYAKERSSRFNDTQGRKEKNGGVADEKPKKKRTSGGACMMEGGVKNNAAVQVWGRRGRESPK